MYTIRRWEGKNGTMYEIEGPGGTWNVKHDKAVEIIREELGYRDAGDAETIVYNAQQSRHPYEF